MCISVLCFFGVSDPDLSLRGEESVDATADEAGAYWDLVYILYPEAVETAGLAAARDLITSWPALEKELQASTLMQRL